MKREPLSQSSEHPQLNKISTAIHSGRYFNKLEFELLKNMVKLGDLVTLNKDDYLIREGDDAHLEMYILVEGSLAVTVQDKFILRLEMPGDVVGEMGVIHPGPRTADVIAEADCQLIAFEEKMFAVDKDAQHAPIFYVMFTHVLAEKLKITTAQSLIRKNERVKTGDHAKIAFIDENPLDSVIVRGILQSNWPEATLIEFESPQQFFEKPPEYRFDLIVGDIFSSNSVFPEKEIISERMETIKLQGAPIFVISEYCNDPLQREWVIKLGATEVKGKPFSLYEVNHTISQFKTWYYKHRELDKAEHEAETDRLTGLANRRRLDEFLDALITLYPDNRQDFSLIIADVDNFKHYNDTQGHQMGDVVLAQVAAIFANNVRRGDLAARFGGEEFVMVLPNCGIGSATDVAEKLRKAVEDEQFPHQELQPSGNLTATFGVATYPGAADLEDLLKQADECLYQGKESGRNVVVVAGSPAKAKAGGNSAPGDS
ncbi:MAG: GGDEF domain-containing protein [SAR324 cluster bacterium]|nr:GGDEF domain-containing protein [SAR324 cluster bacterium]